jgi:hypothetical protein
MLLTEVKECAADGVCKPSTRFDWHHGSGPAFTELTTPLLPPESDLASLMLMDTTGDGLDDLVIGDVEMVSGSEMPTTNWLIAPNRSAELTPSFFESSALAYQQFHEEAPVPVQPDRGTPIDYNHDGRLDLFLHDLHGKYPTWRVLLAKDGPTFAMHDTGIPRPFPLGVVPPLLLASPDASGHLADVSGDGIADLLQCAYAGAGYVWYVHPWSPNTNGFEPKGSLIDTLFSSHCAIELHVLDVDADGKAELLVPGVIETSNGAIFTAKLDALSYSPEGSWKRIPTELPVTPLGGRMVFLDVNGDALPDAVEMKADTPVFQTYYNTGAGFSKAFESFPALVIDAHKFEKLATVIDFNSDGRQDILMPIPQPGGIPAWRILRATGSVGNGTFSVVDPGLPFDAQVLDDQVTLASAHGPSTAISLISRRRPPGAQMFLRRRGRTCLARARPRTRAITPCAAPWGRDVL